MRKLRNDSGLTQEDLVEKAGLSPRSAANTTVATSPLPASTADGSTEDPSWAA